MKSRILPGVDVVAIVIDGRYPHRAPLDHLRQGLVIELDAVLDGIGASAHRILHTGRAVGVNRHPAPAGVRRVDNRLIWSNASVCVVSTLSKLPRDA